MSRRTRMAVLLRRGQWLLDEAAFEIGGGRYTPGQCRDAAHALAELAAALDEYSHESTATGTHAEAESQAQPNEQPAEQPPHARTTAADPHRAGAGRCRVLTPLLEPMLHLGLVLGMSLSTLLRLTSPRRPRARHTRHTARSHSSARQRGSKHERPRTSARQHTEHPRASAYGHPRASARQHTGARPHAEPPEHSRRPAGPARAARGTSQHSPEHQPIAAPPHSPEPRHAGATATAAERTGHHCPSACTTTSVGGRTARREPDTPAPEVGAPAAPPPQQCSAAAAPAPRRSAHHPPERRDPSRSAATGAWPATPAPTPRTPVHEGGPLPKIRNTPTWNAPATTHRTGTATPGPAPTGARTATPATASTPVRTLPRAQTTPRAKPAASTVTAAQPALPLDRELLERVLAGLHRL